MARAKIGGVRRHVMLTAQQDARLDALANKTGMTVSEHLRRAVDSYFRLLDVAALRNPGTR